MQGRNATTRSRPSRYSESQAVGNRGPRPGLGPGPIGFGSGTVIHSSERETLILTCPYLQARRPAASRAERFPRKIMVDLFDGKLHGERPAQVHFVESVEGGQSTTTSPWTSG